MSQSDLINDLLKRTDGSLEQLKLHYGPLIRYVITPILPDVRDREEVFSDILIRVWDRVDQFDPKHGSWTNWLSSIARNAAIDRARRNPPTGAELTEAIPAPNSDPEQELLRKERQKALHAGRRCNACGTVISADTDRCQRRGVDRSQQSNDQATERRDRVRISIRSFFFSQDAVSMRQVHCRGSSDFPDHCRY